MLLCKGIRALLLCVGAWIRSRALLCVWAWITSSCCCCPQHSRCEWPCCACTRALLRATISCAINLLPSSQQVNAHEPGACPQTEMQSTERRCTRREILQSTGTETRRTRTRSFHPHLGGTSDSQSLCLETCTGSSPALEESKRCVCVCVCVSE